MKTALIAFSGGLDTSFLTLYAREAYNVDRVITCTVNTGGFTTAEAEGIAARSKALGAESHINIDASRRFYDTIIKYLIYGNVSRDGYPLCVGSERLVIAEACIEACKEIDAKLFIHGSTGAGNDQYRFDIPAVVLGQGEIECRAPIREFSITRTEAARYLEERGFPVTAKATDYSYNPGLWGVSIGGKETLRSDGLLPEEAWYAQPSHTRDSAIVEIDFTAGELSQLRIEGETVSDPVRIIQRLTHAGNEFGIGRHYHVGTSIPGKKGRLAYESPAADIIYEAHRALEKITLSQAQIGGKKPLAETLGALIHEARMFDPFVGDIKALLASSQRRVTGTCVVRLIPNAISSVTVTSPFDLLAARGSIYGEVSSAYSGADAAGATRLHGYEQELYHSLTPSSPHEKVLHAAQ
jgi:argininosuccinate synthase